VKSLFLMCAVLMFLAANVSQAFTASGSFTVLTPRDKSYVESALLSVVLVGPKDSIDAVRITVNGEEHLPLNRGNSYYVCAGITLVPGPNRIRVEGLKDGTVVGEKEIDVFYRFDLSDRFTHVPSGYERYFFHIPENEKNCIICHQLGSIEDGNSKGRSSCMPCHKNIIAYKYVHGPASVEACETCHRTKSKEGRYGVPEPYSTICYQCHGDTMDSWNKLANVHGPYALGNCTICHSPHGSDHPFFTRKQTTDLCLSCHEDKKSGAHVITSFNGKGHPVRGKPDPLHPGRELTCASCHNPHASNYNHLLFKDQSDVVGFCRACHRF
jgi:predicted CXXCH cytochrome family protein